MLRVDVPEEGGGRGVMIKRIQAVIGDRCTSLKRSGKDSRGEASSVSWWEVGGDRGTAWDVRGRWMWFRWFG